MRRSQRRKVFISLRLCDFRELRKSAMSIAKGALITVIYLNKTLFLPHFPNKTTSYVTKIKTIENQSFNFCYFLGDISPDIEGLIPSFLLLK